MSYEADYILWLEREREKLSFKYDTTKAELYALIEENRKLKEKNEQLEVQKIAFKHSYKQAMEKIERLDKLDEEKCLYGYR